MGKGIGIGSVAAAAIILVLSAAGSALAHCDTLDGPVITQARQALESGDVKRVLPWVAADKEKEIREAFDLASAVRGKGPKEKELADRYSYETVVRVHREGEGAPYTGLKPAGMDLSPAIPAADKALETGDPRPLLSLIDGKVVVKTVKGVKQAALAGMLAKPTTIRCMTRPHPYNYDNVLCPLSSTPTNVRMTQANPTTVR